MKIKLLLLGFFLSFNAFAQCNYSDFSDAPKELFRKRVKESGMRYGNPYTMFVRGDDFNLQNTLQMIKVNIKEGSPKTKPLDFQNDYGSLYYGILQSANEPQPAKCPELQEAEDCLHPAWVKNNAIIYLIGLKYSVVGVVGQFDIMDQAERDIYFNRAHQGLRDLNPNVNSCTWGSIGECGKVRNKAQQLIFYLQAYDLLKAGEAIPIFDRDRNGGSCTARNKLRQFARNVYVQSNSIINSTSGWKKNHGIICASAIGMAAIVLNDAGTENSLADFDAIIGSIGNFFGGSSDVEYAPNYSPINWYERAHGTSGGRFKYGFLTPILPIQIGAVQFGEDGLEDNFFIGKHTPWWVPNVPMTSHDGTAGFAEGPTYFNDLASAWFPYIRTASNFLPTNNPKNYLAQQKYKNLLDWYVKIQNSDHTLPSYDNSFINQGNIIGILGGEYKSPAAFIPAGAEDLRGDFIFAMGAGILTKPEPYYYNENSGNIILRNETQNSKHTFQMLAEKGIAIDKEAGFFLTGRTHEDDDMGAFMIYAGDAGNGSGLNPLAIDPPYTGWEPNKGDNTNKYWMHNTIEIDDGNPAKDRVYKNPQYALIDEGKLTNIQKFNLTFDFKNEDHQLFGSAITRNVNAINNSENFYYFINDYVNAYNVEHMDGVDGTFQYVKLNLNGNGNKDLDDEFSTSTPKLKTYRKEGNLHRWTYPCKLKNWGLTAHIAALGNNNYPCWEANPFNDANNISGGTTLTRLQVHQKLSKTIFQSFLYPQRCSDALPTVTKDETTNYVTTKIRFINSVNTDSFTAPMGKIGPPNKYMNDTASHFHFARWQGGVADSVTNPFNLPAHNNIKLYLDAKKAFVKRNTFGTNMFGYKYCPSSVINTRFASIENGSYLKYNDTFLIKASIQADISLSFTRREQYTCFFNPLSAPSVSDTLQFYLADVGRGVEMVAVTQWEEIIPSRYDSLKRMLYVSMPAVKTTFFLQEKESCKNCYFPENWRGVVDTFEVDNETYNKLGHKLTVKQPNGLLKITKSSSITMCEGMYLQNKNNLIIEGPCQTKAYERKTCKGIDSMVAAYSENSALVVSPFSALVLEPGSHTYIKNGGAIYVKANGSLIIKSGAFVQIGDSGTCNQGWGEIVAEPGAYIHIVPGAHIEYRKTIGDTVDRNFILIPTSAGLLKANEGVHYAIKSILQDDAILPDTTFPFFTYPICGLDTTSPIINKEWGYTSFGKPYATFQARNDTLCPGEPLHISLNRILNDARYQIKVCRMDSIQVNTPLGGKVWQDTCIMDTIVQDEILPDPVCKEPRNTPGDWTYYFNPGTLHRVTISVWNECGDIDDSIAYIYTALPPNITINVPETACEGNGTLNATVNVTPNQVYNYAIEVTEKIDTSSLNYKNGTHSESYSQSYNGLLPPTINFDNYFFKGGSTYLISLSVANDCGSYSVYDSVTIPLGASISLTRPTVYGNNISGATAVQLNGMVLNADSFRWEPTTWLDTATSLTPISTPTDSITYVLIAKGGTCTATDTVHIKYNRFANAGYSDTLCSNNGTAILLGFPYDMSLFLGMLYYYDNAQFMSYYNSHNTSNAPNYFRYFTHFMHTDNFKNSAISCPIDLYNLFNNTLHKQIFFSTSWYRGYYMQFSHFNSLSLNALDIFADQVLHNSTLKDHLDSLNNWGNIDPCINNILNLYDDYLQNHAGEISTTWTKITGNDTTSLSSWNNFFVAENAPLKSSTYLLSVITPDRAEIDEITILVDTTLTPLFAPGMQFDSTVFFMNYTEPISTATTYEWNFGDGSANSNEQNPIHTFPAFDSSYKVCLTASNKCNTWQYCDTVFIDSLHLGGSLKTANKPAFFETNNSSDKSESLNDRLALSNKLEARSKELVALQNYPNPFNQSTIIDYQIWQSFSQAELRITNVLGQVLYTQKLQKPIDKVEIDGSNLANGLYYYSIVVDNNIKLTKTMSVIH